jgi:CBS domain-containing protein
MKARDIMTPHPTVVTPAEPIAQAARLMRDRDVGSVPVVADTASMRLEGIITDRDIAVRCVATGQDGRSRVQEHMTSGHLGVVRENDDLSEVVKKMEADQVRRIPVVADGGRLVGMIAQADIARRVGPRDPTLVEEVVERISEPAHAHG